MAKSNPPYGNYHKSFITDIPANLQSAEATKFRITLPKFPEEAIYIYSFDSNRMIYAEGWYELLGLHITLPIFETKGLVS